jgi:hypothetical protein
LLYGDDDPFAYVVSANVHRRHLTTEQKREVVAALLKSRPERSDRATAAIAKVSDKTVGDVRSELGTFGNSERRCPNRQPRPAATGNKASRSDRRTGARRHGGEGGV